MVSKLSGARTSQAAQPPPPGKLAEGWEVVTGGPVRPNVSLLNSEGVYTANLFAGVSVANSVVFILET